MYAFFNKLSKILFNRKNIFKLENPWVKNWIQNFLLINWKNMNTILKKTWGNSKNYLSLYRREKSFYNKKRWILNSIIQILIKYFWNLNLEQNKKKIKSL
jgi:hypothetical protein